MSSYKNTYFPEKVCSLLYYPTLLSKGISHIHKYMPLYVLVSRRQMRTMREGIRFHWLLESLLICRQIIGPREFLRSETSAHLSASLVNLRKNHSEVLLTLKTVFIKPSEKFLEITHYGKWFQFRCKCNFT